MAGFFKAIPEMDAIFAECGGNMMGRFMVESGGTGEIITLASWSK